jgi:hypothetical protein
MDILKNIDELLISWGTAPSLADMLDQFIAFVLVLIVAFLADVICRNILLKVVAHLIRKTKATWDDIVFDRKVLIHLSRMVARYHLCLYSGSLCRDEFFHVGLYPACLPDLYSNHIPKFYQLVSESRLCRIQREGAASRPPFEGYVADCPGDTLVCRGYRGGKYSD